MQPMTTKTPKQLKMPHPDKVLLTVTEMCALYGINRMLVWREREKQDSTFPKAIIFGSRTQNYLRSDVDAWIASKRDGVRLPAPAAANTARAVSRAAKQSAARVSA